MTRILLTVFALLIALAAPARAEIAFIVDINNNLFRTDVDVHGSNESILIGPLTGLRGSKNERDSGDGCASGDRRTLRGEQ